MYLKVTAFCGGFKRELTEIVNRETAKVKRETFTTFEIFCDLSPPKIIANCRLPTSRFQ